VEPDLAQAQSLSETKNALRSAEIGYQEARKNYEDDSKLFSQGLLAPKAHRDTKTAFLNAQQEYQKAQEKYGIVERSGIPISQSAANFSGSNVVTPMSGIVLKKNVEIGETVTSGVSSFNAGTVLFTVADVSSMIIKVGVNEVEIGETVTSGVSSFNAGTVLFTVADVSSMIIKVGVNEVDIGKIHVDQPVKVTLDAYPKVAFAGKISRIAPAVRIDEKVRVFDVEVRLDAQGKELRSGMTANVEVIGERKPKVLTIPVEAVFQRDEGDVIYLRKEVDPKVAAAGKEKKGKDGKPDKDAWKKTFERKVVTTGLSDNSRVEIVAGLKLGDEVALEDPTLPKDKKNDEDD